MNRFFHDLAPMFRIINNHLNHPDTGMRATNDDKAIVITGVTGAGKSFLALELFDYYMTKIIGLDHEKENFDFFCISDSDWIKALDKAKQNPFYMICHDEAINILYAKEALSKKNREVNKLFKQIRGKCFYHVLLIPQVHRLDREFREDRIVGLINVYKRNGIRYAQYYSKHRVDVLLNELDQMNKNLSEKEKRTSVMSCKTRPNFTCKIPMYKGPYLKYYLPLKRQNMDDAIDRTFDTIVGKREHNKDVAKMLTSRLKRMITRGNTIKGSAKELGIGYSTARAYLKKSGYDEEEVMQD